jgi:hypothetical protein
VKFSVPAHEQPHLDAWLALLLLGVPVSTSQAGCYDEGTKVQRTQGMICVRLAVSSGDTPLGGPFSSVRSTHVASKFLRPKALGPKLAAALSEIGHMMPLCSNLCQFSMCTHDPVKSGNCEADLVESQMKRIGWERKDMPWRWKGYSNGNFPRVKDDREETICVVYHPEKLPQNKTDIY